MLGQPYSMLLPEVIGFKLSGKLKEGVTATDLVLTVTQMLRKRGVVGKFVEFFGPGLAASHDRRPRHPRQHGAGIRRDLRLLPDRRRHHPLSARHRPPGRADRARAAYAKAQGMYRTKTTPDPMFTEVLKLDLASVEPSLAGPKRPQDRVALKDVKAGFASSMDKEFGKGGEADKRVPVEGKDYDLGHGDVVIAAITSCTNTSNPSVMIGAGLLARKAAAKGLAAKPWVKTSLAPGSQVVAEYLEQVRPAEGSRQARLQPGRLRLHHLHRQFRPAAGGDFQGDQRATIWWPPRCSRATAISKAASTPTCAPTISPRRRWSSPTRSPARCRSISPRRRSAPTRRARRSSSRTSGRPTRRSARSSARTSPSRCSPRNTPTSSRATPIGARSRSRAALTYRVGRSLDLRAEPALFRRHGASGRGRSRTSSTPACSGCSSIRSPPTTSRRRDRSRKRARPANTCAITRCGRRTSTNTARGAAITR